MIAVSMDILWEKFVGCHPQQRTTVNCLLLGEGELVFLRDGTSYWLLNAERRLKPHTRKQQNGLTRLCLFIFVHTQICNKYKQRKGGSQLECRGRGRDAEEASWEAVEEGKGDGEVMQFCFD